jgi:hypothetical protein
VVITSDCSGEPVVDFFKQGAGDMRACGPSSFIYVDSFKNHGEVFPITTVGCATPNANENVEIASKENAESAEIDAKDVIKIEKIDLSEKFIESSTGFDSVSAEIAEPYVVIELPSAFADPAISIADPVDEVAEPLGAVADPVDTGKVLTEICSQGQNTINLCQTVSCNSTSLNVLFDLGATLTLANKKVAEMGIEHENVKYELNTISTNHFEGQGAAQVPLALPDGQVHVLKALVVDGPLGQVDMHPPPPLML